MNHELIFHGTLADLADPEAFDARCAKIGAEQRVIRTRCVSERNRDMHQAGAGEDSSLTRMIRYLARYTNRVAISNGRLLAIDGDAVLFRYKDYRDADQWKTRRMPGVEFIGRFLQHILPQQMPHIRHYGFISNNFYKESLAWIREVLEVGNGKATIDSREEECDEREQDDVQEEITRVCRHCGQGTLHLIKETRRPTVDEIMRMPASMERPLTDNLSATNEQTADRGPVQLLLPTPLPPCYDYS